MSIRRRVLVTGVGALSPIGLDAESSFRALLEGRSGIGPITQFDCSNYAARIAGEVRGFDVDQFMDGREAKKVDRFVHFAVAAARMAVTDAGLDLEKLDRDRAGVVIGSGIGGLHLLEQQHRIILEKGPRRLSPFLIPGMIINLASGMVSIELGFRGPNSATVTACATGNHAIGDAMRMIQHGDADVMVAGGTEAVISPIAVGGFCAMRALSTRNDEPERASRPFDKDRDGFVIGEGCGVLMLESEEHALRRGARVYAEMAGFGMSADAFHLSAPPEDGNGMIRVMHAGLKDANLQPQDIDYINAHATSTPVGDVIEARAISQVFAAKPTPIVVSSTKSMTGHLLGAAGGFEAVATVLAINRGVVPPTINLGTLDPEIMIDCVPNHARSLEITAAMSNSFGFGGTNATLIFKRV
ncbi:MAG: beta-ketoacyl-ACP synthase II [Acidobacteriota bacterium]